jgi:hypothetical protein
MAVVVQQYLGARSMALAQVLQRRTNRKVDRCWRPATSTSPAARYGIPAGPTVAGDPRVVDDVSTDDHDVRRASVGLRRAAQPAGYRPATAPMTSVAARPPQTPVAGTRVCQPREVATA